MSVAKLHLVEEKVVPSPKAKAKKPRAKAIAMPQPEATGSAKAAASTKKSVPNAPKTKKREALVCDVMSSPALACSKHGSLNEAVRLMWENDVGAVVIVDDENKPVGMLTDRDACMAVYTQGIPLFHGSVSSAMSKSIVVCEQGRTIAELREMMSEAQIRRVPIVDAAGELVGLAGVSDLLLEANATLPKERKRGSTGPMMMSLVDSILQKN